MKQKWVVTTIKGNIHSEYVERTHTYEIELEEGTTPPNWALKEDKRMAKKCYNYIALINFWKSDK